MLGMLLVDTLVYLLVGLYATQLNPGPYAAARDALFFLRPSFWRGVPAGEERRLIGDVGGARSKHACLAERSAAARSRSRSR